MRRPEILMTPGPTPVPPEVLLAQASPIVYHRGPGYGALLREVTEGLKYVLQTENDVVVYTSSGTGGMESAVANLFSPGDRVLVVSVGYFGDRFVQICKAYGLDVRVLEYQWGQVARAEDLARALEREGPVKAVLCQHSETSTGVVNDVAALGAVCREAGVPLVVDAISGVGAVELKTDAWGVDVAIGASQKALMGSPGIAFLSVSPKAWEMAAESRCPKFYFSWEKTLEAYRRPDPESPFTPAVSVLLGVREALRMIREEGLEAVLERHALLSRATKEGVRALGLELFGEHPERSHAVTAVRVPEGLDGKAIVREVRRRYGVILAGGQGPLAGKIFRIGHLGYYDGLDVVRALSALELTLEHLGYPVKRGSAVGAAEEVLARG